jgi:hypothetical protein
MLILSTSSFVHWIFMKLAIIFFIAAFFAILFVFVGSIFSSDIRDLFGFH